MKPDQFYAGFGMSGVVPVNEFVDCQNSVDEGRLNIAHRKMEFNMTNNNKNGAFTIGATYVSCLFVAIWLLDIFDMFGRITASEELSRFACASLSSVKIASPLISDRLVNFSVQQCLAQPIHEPATSIILFMGKISLTILAALYYSLVQIFSGFPDLQEKLSFYKNSGGNILDVVNYKIKGLVAFAMMYVAFLFPFKTLPSEFGTNIPRKGTEDLSSLILFVCLALFVDVIFAGAFYVKEKMKT